MGGLPTIPTRILPTTAVLLIGWLFAGPTSVPVVSLWAQNLTNNPPFSAERLKTHIRTLSSDEFEGRGPGTKGEQLTIDYIQKQFRDMGRDRGIPMGVICRTCRLWGSRPIRR